MISLIGLALLASTAAVTPSDPCAGDPKCLQASAGQLFAAADALAEQGDLAGAEALLEALTQDPAPELRAEARFRLAALREKREDPAGAISALRALLDEQPNAARARLELSRLLALQGDDRAARRELRKAAASGLPEDVARTVSRFSTALNARKRRGASIELAAGPDSNINRATSDQFIDTVIAPFTLDPDARGQSGVGLSLGGQAYSRDPLLGGTLLSRASLRGDFYGKTRFNDVQLSLSSGPDITTGIGRLRPALTHERRWYGGNAYSSGYGAVLSWLPASETAGQLELNASAVHQSIRNNAVLDGDRYALSAAYDRVFNPQTSGRIALSGVLLDTVAKPESLVQGGGEALIAHKFGFATMFAQAGYTKVHGRAPLALFGKTRDDDRIDLGAGIVATRLSFAGIAPMLRLIYTRSASNLELYDYRRTRVELGFSREF